MASKVVSQSSWSETMALEGNHMDKQRWHTECIWPDTPPPTKVGAGSI